MRFLVDGIMQTSPDLPTTVDFGNNLVNYIEVIPEDPNKAAKKAALAEKAAEPADADAQTRASRSASQSKEQPKPPRERTVLSPDSYASEIPQYLQDFDQAEDSPAYQNAVAAIDKLPTPPSLPGFLGKPILNAAVLMKDDNSVLNMPNHTVLNHLATSSIKNGILAVSATTRYRNKVSLNYYQYAGNVYLFDADISCSMSQPSFTSRLRWTNEGMLSQSESRCKYLYISFLGGRQAAYDIIGCT